MRTAVLTGSLVCCSGLALDGLPRHARAAAARAASVRCKVAPPPGFEWGVEVSSDAATAPVANGGVQSWYDAGVRLTEDEAEACVPFEAYFCNEQGCWIGTPEELAPPPVVLPDGRKFCESKGVVTSHKESIAEAKANKPKVVATQGIFAPAVLGAKAVMGTKELNKLRAEVIAQHTKVISAFVDTSDSAFGQLVLKQMFEAADKDGNGTLDREEIRDALQALGFTFVEGKLLDKIMDRADDNGDQVIDFEEFVKESPKTLRSSLVKLAKRNGHDLGFLA